MSPVRRATLERVAAVFYALVDWLVIMAPSLAVKLAAHRGGLDSDTGLDLLLASALVATPHAIVAARRLLDEERRAVRGADTWIASIDALVVLALSTTLLIVVVLAFFATENAALANRGLPVVTVWFVLQIVAVILAEITGRVVFWWLEPHRPRSRPWGRPADAPTPGGDTGPTAGAAAARAQEGDPVPAPGGDPAPVRGAAGEAAEPTRHGGAEA